jgi:predicted dehydrogenase
LAHAVLAAGKDVIMEKPIARSSAEGAALLQAARSAGKRLIVAEQFAYCPLEERLIDLLQAGAIGEIVAWDRAQHFDGDMEQGELRYDSTPWRKQADFPLGALFDGGIHRLAALSRVFGAPQHVFASGRKLRPDYGDYDYVAMLFEYQGGRVGYFSYSPCLTPLQDYYVIHGAAGVITVDANKCITLKRPGQADCLIEVAPASDHERMWQAIVQFLQHGVEPGYTAEMALRDVTILEAVERSLKSGERTHIQLATG